MFNTKIVCTKCKSGIKKYDALDKYNQFYKEWVFCPYCGAPTKHEGWSPNL